MATLTLADFSIGDTVLFGRTRGEKTKGTVIRKGRRKLKVRQDEARGTMKDHQVGSIWTVSPSLCRKVKGASAPVTTATATPPPRPPARGSDSTTFTRVAKRNGFDAGLLGKTIKVGRSKLTIVGSNPRAPKYPFLAEGVRGGRYKVTAAQIRNGLAS